MLQYSVLMSVYYKEKPEYLRQSIQSMLDQTIPTNDFVIVCDGGLTKALDEVLISFTEEFPYLFQIIRLKENKGIGFAAKEGLTHCKNELVAKMDADDISRPDRCEKQLKMFEQNSDLTIVGSQIFEFENNITNIISQRRVPLEHEKILSFGKRRMPFNNQTVMYRKSAVLAVGSYSALRRCEDYDLYARLLYQGYQAANINKSLVYVRLDDEAYKRRGRWNTFYGFVLVHWKIHKMGFSNFLDFLIPCAAQVVICFVPTKLKRLFYKQFLRG